MHLFSRLSRFFAASRRGGAPVDAARRPARPRRLFAIALVTLLGIPACSTTTSYRGTGSLQWSGSAAAELATHDVEISICSGGLTPDSRTATFALISIGGTCLIESSGEDVTFQPDPGQECVLPFANGPRAFRVTDATVRYSQVRHTFRGSTTTDGSYVEVTVGGDDAITGQHALYHFEGSERYQPDAQPRCKAAREDAAARLRNRQL